MQTLILCSGCSFIVGVGSPSQHCQLSAIYGQCTGPIASYCSAVIVLYTHVSRDVMCGECVWVVMWYTLVPNMGE